jgi:hypothetical protein
VTSDNPSCSVCAVQQVASVRVWRFKFRCQVGRRAGMTFS